MKLDLIYINEAKRIRKSYLTSLSNIVKKEDEIKKLLTELEDIKNEVDESTNTSDEYYNDKILEISKKIESIQNYIIPHYTKIQELDKDQSKLYGNIKDKYPNITDKDIRAQVVPEVMVIDQEFAMYNDSVYNRIKDR